MTTGFGGQLIDEIQRQVAAEQAAQWASNHQVKPVHRLTPPRGLSAYKSHDEGDET